MGGRGRAQVSDCLRKIEDQDAELYRAEMDGKGMREQYREELRKAEAEARQVRRARGLRRRVPREALRRLL